MWRECADNGVGVSIGFRPRALKDMPLRNAQVHYIGSETAEEFFDLLGELLYKPLFSSPPLQQMEVAALCGEIAAKMASIKHSRWSYENEIRLSHAAPPDNVRVEIEGVKIPSAEYPDGTEFFSTVQVRDGVSDLPINYVPLSFVKYTNREHDAARSIERVVRGPKSAAAIEEIELMLTQHGF